MTDQYEALRAKLQASIARLLASADPKYRDGFRAQALMIDTRVELARAITTMIDAGLGPRTSASAIGAAFGDALCNLVANTEPEGGEAIALAAIDAFTMALRRSANTADVVSADLALSAGRA